MCAFCVSNPIWYTKKRSPKNLRTEENFGSISHSYGKFFTMKNDIFYQTFITLGNKGSRMRIVNISNGSNRLSFCLQVEWNPSDRRKCSKTSK